MSIKKTIVRILKEHEDDYQEILEYNRQLEFLKKYLYIHYYIKDYI